MISSYPVYKIYILLLDLLQQNEKDDNLVIRFSDGDSDSEGEEQS